MQDHREIRRIEELIARIEVDQISGELDGETVNRLRQILIERRRYIEEVH
jgi:hypothetical protein